MRALRNVRWGFIAVLIAFPVFTVCVVVLPARVAWTVRESYGRTAMQKRLDALASAGKPIDDDSAEALYQSRTSPTHTNRWLAVMDQFDTEEFKQSQQGVSNFDPQLTEEPFAATGQWSSEAATRRFIEAHQPLIDEVRELCQYREPVRFPIVFDSINSLLPYTQRMRDVGRLLWTDGQIAIRDRESARLARDIEALHDASRVSSAEPWAVSQLVCISIESMAIDLTKVSLEHDCLASEDLKRLLPRFVEQSKLKNQWQRMIEGERSSVLPCFVEPNRGTDGGSSLPARGWDCIMYLDLMDKALAIDASTLDSLLAGGRRLAADFEQEYRSGGWLRSVDGIMTNLMAPAFDALAEAIVRNRTEHRLAAHAIAVAIFRKSQGRWPSDFSEVDLPDADLSPPGGKPFGYRIEEDGRACLWGFNVRSAQSTPPEPPSLDLPAGERAQLEPFIWHLAPN